MVATENGVPQMRQIQIDKPAKKAIKARTRTDRYELDLRTPAGRVLGY